jgi:hypothetical protein
MVVSSQNRDTSSVLPVPDPDSLVVRGADHPSEFKMELYSSDVVQMAFKGVQAFFLFEVPEFDLVVVPS